MTIILPTTIKVIDIVYSIEYVDKPSDVDIHRRESLWGQIDPWTRTIRIYSKDNPPESVMQVVWHEIMHAICEKLHIKTEAGDLNDQEVPIDLLATAINSVLQDNPALRGVAE